MEPKKSYSEQLKDPRWQKKRLQILERDQWKCVQCGNDKLTLHVHHKSYSDNKCPWEYEDSNLITLCESCHESYHDLEKNLIKVIPDKSIIDPVDVVLAIPGLNTYFCEIRNHKGLWTLKLRKDITPPIYYETLALLIGYAWFDMDFEIHGFEEDWWHDPTAQIRNQYHETIMKGCYLNPQYENYDSDDDFNKMSDNQDEILDNYLK